MKVTIDNDFRGLTKGTEYIFPLDDVIQIMCIVGDNGCGKSSLLNAIAGKFLPKKEGFGNIIDNNRGSLAKNISLSDHNFEACFCFDASKEGSATIDTSYDAPSYVANGGFYADRKSHGEGEMIYLTTFLQKIQPMIIPNKTLVCLDEFDKGFSLSNQIKSINFANRLVEKFKCKVLICTHNPFLMRHCYVVYDFADRQYIASKEYIVAKTGFEVNYIKPI